MVVYTWSSLVPGTSTVTLGKGIYTLTGPAEVYVGSIKICASGKRFQVRQPGEYEVRLGRGMIELSVKD